MLKKFFGPSTLIAAAFIGPGTVTVCTMTGATHGYSLLWALLFSIIATIVLQEMALRLGIITQSGLGETIRKQVPDGLLKIAMVFIIFSAIIIGNAAYEAGNISGAVLGVQVFNDFKFWPFVIGIIAAGLLFSDAYKLIEKLLVALVITMSITFLITAIALKPNLANIFSGLIPNFNGLDFMSIMAIVGTTIVPYNLFLHASIIHKKYKQPSDLKEARIENIVSICLGGIISMLIMIVSATVLFGSENSIQNAIDMATQLEPILGSYAKYLFGIGLFAAGLSSAITAPMAAAYAASGLFGWKANNRDKRFLAVWLGILLIGVFMSTVDIPELKDKFISIIYFAQIANGLLLPIITIYLLYLANKSEILKTHVNSKLQNVLGIVILLVTILISAKTFISLIQSYG